MIRALWANEQRMRLSGTGLIRDRDFVALSSTPPHIATELGVYFRVRMIWKYLGIIESAEMGLGVVS